MFRIRTPNDPIADARRDAAQRVVALDSNLIGCRVLLLLFVFLAFDGEGISAANESPDSQAEAARGRPVPELAVFYDPGGPDDFNRSYAYFPPRNRSSPDGASTSSKPALIVFVQSRFWSERQPDALIGSGFVKGVIQAGHTAAVVRHRPVSEAAYPAPVQDVAAGVAHLLARHASLGFDPERVFLAGHSSGAQLALLIALDPTWLAAQGASPDSIAGVASLSGILDLSKASVGTSEEEARYAAAFPKASERKAASPIEWLDRDRPAILLLTAERDVPGYAESAERFVERARSEGSGVVERFVAVGRDHFSILDLARRDGPSHALDFFASAPREGRLPEMWEIASTWRNPPFSSEGFHDLYGDRVRRYESDARFTEAMNRPFKRPPGGAPRLRFAHYEAIDLVDWLEARFTDRGPDGWSRNPGGARGDLAAARAIPDDAWLELTNVRGEQALLRMGRLRELSPRLVVGLEGERNLFRATDLYHTIRRYSWVDAQAGPVLMARPLGAFLFFPSEEPAPAEASPLFGRYALAPDSFRLHATNPRAVLGDLSASERQVLIERNHCLSCHRFRGVGGRALHLRARDGARMGGHALPLERYPEVVWKRFVFEQEAVAAEVGADVVSLTPMEARTLYDLVVRERTKSGVVPWRRPARDRDSDQDPQWPAR